MTEIAHRTIGFSIEGNVDPLERAQHIMDRLVKQVPQLKRAFSDVNFSDGITKNIHQYEKLGTTMAKAADTHEKAVNKITEQTKRMVNSQSSELDKGKSNFSDFSRSVKNDLKDLPTRKTYRVTVESNGDKVKSDMGRIKRSEESVTRSSAKMSRTIHEHSGRVTKAFGGMSSLSSKLRNATVAAVPGTLTLGAAFGYSANQAVKLQKQYTTIKNLLVTGGEKASHAIANVNKMQSQGRKLSLKYGESQKGISAGYEELVRRGYTSNQALAAQKTLIQGSIASGDKYSDVVHNATAALESFGLRSDNVNKMTQNTKMEVNQMAYAADLTATDFQGMGDALRYVGATAHSTNQSLAETTSAIGILSNNGLEDTQAGTGLRKIMNAFGSPTMTAKSQQGQVMEQLHLKASDFTNAAGKVKSLADNFKVLNKATSGMSDSAKFNVFHKFFGTTGQEAALILNKNVGQMKALNKQVAASQNQKGGGYVANLSKKNMNSWQVQLKRFQAALQELGISFAKSVLPEVTAMAKGLTWVVNKFAALPKWAKQWTLNLTLAGAALLPIAAAVTTVAANLKMISGSSSILSMFGKESRGTVSATESLVPEVGSRVGNSHFANASKLAGVASAGKSLLKGYGYFQLADQGVQFASNAVNVFQKGLHGSGVTSAWKMGGQAVGGGIGAFLGGPAGAGIGAQIGGFIAEKIPKAVKNSVTTSQKWADNPKHGVQKGSVFIPGAGWSFNPRGGGNALKKAPAYKATSVRSAVSSWTYASLSKANQAYIKKAVQLEQQGNVEWAQSAGKASSSLKKTYNSLYDLAKRKANSQLSNDRKGYSWLEKAGLLSSATAQKTYNAEKSTMTKRLSTLHSGLNKLVNSESKNGKTRAREINKVNRQILSLTDAGAAKQKTIWRNLMSRTTHLSISGYSKIITSSNSAYKKTILNAKKTYKSEVSTADKRLSEAKHLAKTLPDLSISQRKAIVKQAEKQRDTTISNAKSQYTGAVKWAKQQREKVVAEAKKEAGSAADAFNESAKDIGKSIPALLATNFSAGLSAMPKKFKSADLTNSKSSGLQKQAQVISKISSGSAGHIPGQNGTASKAARSKLPENVFAHATGTAHAKPGLALVGEGGRELAYSVYGRKARLLGINGPEFARIRSGEKILNARDTNKVLSGRFGAGKVLPGYAKGTATLSKDTDKSAKKIKKDVSADYTGAFKSATDSMKKFHKYNSNAWKNNVSTTNKRTNQVRRNTTADYLATNRNATSELKSFNKRNQSLWKDTSGDTNHYTNQIRHNSTTDYSEMGKQIVHDTNETHKQLNKVWSGIVSDFAHIFGKLKGYMHAAVAGAIGQLNGGISGIDKVLSQFGGNSSVIKPVHYAAGSNGRLGEDQWAMVNDATSGPKQELILRGNQVLAPQGEKAILPLKRNDRVLNGRQSQEFAAMRGITHFAKGSGVPKSELRKLIKNNDKKPHEAFKNEFSSKIKFDGTFLQKNLTALGKRATTTKGNPWSSAAWGALVNAMSSSGGAAAGGTWRHSPGLKETNPFGASRAGMYGAGAKHDGVDFSGPLGSAIRAVHGGTVFKVGGTGIADLGKVIEVKSSDGFKEIYQEFGQMHNIKVKVGDVIRAGQKIATLGTLVGAGSGSHVHIGITKGDPLHQNMLSTQGWYDVTKMRGRSSGTPKVKKTDKHESALTKFVDKQLSSQIKWVKKHLRESSSLGSLSLSGSIASRARKLAVAIKKLYPSATDAGISAVLGNWEFESGLNPGAINPGGGASGLGQWLGGRKTNLINALC